MTLADRLKQIRRELGVSQEAIGAQGFMSAPGWVKVENGQRPASENLLSAFVDWLVRDRHVPAKNRAPLLEELLTLKYLSSRQPFVRSLARGHARTTPWGSQLLAAFDAATAHPRQPARRGRPAGTGKRKTMPR